jgi:hypothetical protein
MHLSFGPASRCLEEDTAESVWVRNMLLAVKQVLIFSIERSQLAIEGLFARSSLNEVLSSIVISARSMVLVQ